MLVGVGHRFRDHTTLVKRLRFGKVFVAAGLKGIPLTAFKIRPAEIITRFHNVHFFIQIPTHIRNGKFTIGTENTPEGVPQAQGIDFR